MRIIPPGVILSNAPVEFMRRLVAEGRAVFIDEDKPSDGLSAAPACEAIVEPARQEKTPHVVVATAQKGTRGKRR